MAYLRPTTIASALAARAELPRALVCGGGTAVQPAMNAGLLRPADVLDLGGLRDGAAIDACGDRVRLGPVVRVAAAARAHALGAGVLDGLLRGFATPAVRERATLTGNLFQAPADLAVVLTALDGSLIAAGARSRGERRLPVTMASALRPDELAIGLDLTVPAAFAYERLAVREVAAPTLAAVAAALLPGGPRAAVTGYRAGTAVPCPGAVPFLADPAGADGFAAAVVAAAAPPTPYARRSVAALAHRCHRRIHRGDANA
ncbi:FAD binding domain-containing protein [Acrocarpospora sp. B8E8]|uniref:FAD binding domain-containing protein n=1 Tax=Acrocarpospora sp. B8E8 TaxID=3153572 RepID=UPI00325E1FE7